MGDFDKQEETVIINVPTSNKFDVQTQQSEISKPKLKSHNIALVIGNSINSRRAYPDRDFKVTVLGQEKKNIDGAKDFIENHETPQHLILGVLEIMTCPASLKMNV